MSESFTQRVYALCSRVPRGRVTTYQEIARALGVPGASRAVGNALHANQHLIAMPCHRVVRSNGMVGGYVAGVGRKKEILRQEGIICTGDRVVDFARVLYHFPIL